METSELITEILNCLTTSKEILNKTGIGDTLKSMFTQLREYTKGLFSNNQKAATTLQDYEKEPSNEMNKGMLMAFLETELDKENSKLEEMRKLVTELLNEIKKDKQIDGIYIKNSKNVVTGGIHHVTGNFKIGDNINKP